IGEGRRRRRRDAHGIQHGPLLLHRRGRGPPPVAHRLGHARLPRTCFTMPTNVSCTPAPVFALAYDHGQPRSRKNDSTSAGGGGRAPPRSPLFTPPAGGVSPAPARVGPHPSPS